MRPSLQSRLELLVSSLELFDDRVTDVPVHEQLLLARNVHEAAEQVAHRCFTIMEGLNAPKE